MSTTHLMSKKLSTFVFAALRAITLSSSTARKVGICSAIHVTTGSGFAKELVRSKQQEMDPRVQTVEVSD